MYNILWLLHYNSQNSILDEKIASRMQVGKSVIGIVYKRSINTQNRSLIVKLGTTL